MDLGIPEQQYCLHSQISPETLCETTLRDSGVINLLEKLFNHLQIQSFVPLEASLNNTRVKNILLTKPFMLKDSGP